MSKPQKSNHTENLKTIKENEFNARYWKSQNDMMYEILRNEELLPRYLEHVDKVKAEIKAAEAEQSSVINENTENPKIVEHANPQGIITGV